MAWLRRLNLDDAVLVVMMAEGKPLFAWEIAGRLNRENYDDYPSALRARVMGRLISLEKRKVVKRRSGGWMVAARASRFVIPIRVDGVYRKRGGLANG